MSELNDTERVNDAPATGEPPAPEFAPKWGAGAPRGGKTVVTRALKDGARVPLFLGQTLINSLRDLGYNSTTSALCEHVDNALEWGATEVRVYFRQTGKQPNQKIDVLVYDNGQGMAPHVLKVAMAFGGSMVFDNRAGIGRYGMGMKAAALNIARSVDVYSWQEPRAYYSMTLDVDKIGQDRNNMIELPDPEISDTLPSDIADILTEPMDYPKRADESQDLLADGAEGLDARLGRSGTIVYMPNCDRLTYSTARGLVDHAVKELGRVYRRFIDRSVRLYVNNRRVEAFDPTFWMPSARHTRVEGVTETRSALIDSWPVTIPVAEGATKTTEIHVRVFLLPVEAWSVLSRDTVRKKLHVFEDHAVSYMRNDREVEIGWEPRLKLRKHTTDYWLRVEIDFTGEADAGFGVAANKQGVRLKEYVAKLIMERLGPHLIQLRKTIREKQLKVAATEQAGQTGDAERYASEADAIQAVALPAPPADTREQAAALEANLRGLAVSLRQEGETEEQAYRRVKESKYLTDYKYQEYAPFYDTEYKFGKLILRVNTAHPFYQKVWQPLGELAKKAIPSVDRGEVEGMEGDIAAATRKAQMGVQLLLLSLARAQTQMLAGDPGGEQAQVQLFRNLRKSWSDVLETQFLHVE
jgi:Histidine kinase-, DNA gyrase B-, and HSP90-like ATPase